MRKSPNAGLLWGLAGVVSFSLTLPATRLAVQSIDPVFVGMGRAIIATLLAIPLLYFTSQPKPGARQWRGLFAAGLGVVIGFPMLTAMALKTVPASHGAVIIGILPLATAIAGALRAGERPSRLFWCGSLAGAACVSAYAMRPGQEGFQAADLLLVCAVAFGAFGYAEGAVLARQLGGWQSICWSLLAVFPLSLIPAAASLLGHGFQPSPISLGSLFYLGAVSMFLGFFAWYHGLATGGIAKVSQLQLLQPFFTLLFSSHFMGKSVEPRAWRTVGLVVTCIAVTRLAAVKMPVAKLEME